MIAADAVREAVRNSGRSMISISVSMGVNANYVAKLVARGGSPKVDTIASIAEECGYRLAMVPEAEVSESDIVIDGRKSKR